MLAESLQNIHICLRSTFLRSVLLAVEIEINEQGNNTANIPQIPQDLRFGVTIYDGIL